MAVDDAVALELFIKKVREYPVLYDQDHCDYSDKRVREAIWKEIGEYFHSSAALVQRKWQILRGSFRRTHRYLIECERQRMGDNRPVKRRRVWKYYHQMTFILPQIEEIQQHSLFTHYLSGPEIEDPTPKEAEFLDMGTPSIESSGVSSEYQPDLKTLKLETTHDIEQSEDDFEDDKPKDTDGLQKFFESMYETVRNFPVQYQRKAKRAVFEAVFSIENEVDII